MIDGFIARSMREYKKSNELLLVTATAVALDNIRSISISPSGESGWLPRTSRTSASSGVSCDARQSLFPAPASKSQDLDSSFPHPASCASHPASRITVRPRSAQAFVLSACHTAMKATPERVLKLTRVRRSTSALCRERKRKKSWLGYQSPGPQRC